MYLSIPRVIWYEMLLFIWLKFYTKSREKKQFLEWVHHFDGLLVVEVHSHVCQYITSHENLNLISMMHEMYNYTYTKEEEKILKSTCTFTLEFCSRSSEWYPLSSYKRANWRAFIALYVKITKSNSVKANQIVDFILC